MGCSKITCPKKRRCMKSSAWPRKALPKLRKMMNFVREWTNFWTERRSSMSRSSQQIKWDMLEGSKTLMYLSQENEKADVLGTVV